MNNFKFQTEQFADIKILRYLVPVFQDLNLRQKKLLFFLHEAALCGRDIFWDQNYKHNLLIRRNLENIYLTYNGNKTTESWKEFVVYLKRLWFSNGIHHHYSNDKILPSFNIDDFDEFVMNSASDNFDLQNFKSLEELIIFFKKNVFNADIDSKKINQKEGEDLVKTSSVNFYENISQKEVEDYYNSKIQATEEPLSLGMNSKIVKINGEIKELVWKKDGLYGNYIKQIINNLSQALPYCENDIQRKSFLKLIEYYETGNLKNFDEYSILWVSDTKSEIDVINGFIEVYADPLGRKATFESTVSIIDIEATKRASIISNNALWFEQHSTTDKKFKKEKITGVSAKAVNVVVESGDCSPSTPIGINLPNADWIRTKYGSKSVTISNIISAYDEVSKDSGALSEFAYNEEEIRLSKEWSSLGSNLHVDMHEIIGHGSGKIANGVGDTAETLKNYASTIEEARADLVALYFAIDEKLIDLGLMKNIEAGIAEYNSYIRGGLMTQLVRIEAGKNLEESHMRNRQLIALWAYELGKSENVIERKQKDGKSYFVINDHQKLREIFGIELKEIQRIKSEGDYNKAKELVEKYGVIVDKKLHKEILERWKKLNIAPYSGFINPLLKPILKDNEIVDIEILYPEDFAEQMIYYSLNYGRM